MNSPIFSHGNTGPDWLGGGVLSVGGWVMGEMKIIQMIESIMRVDG